jgi:hypothetical protein
MALELGRDGRWESDQTMAFEALARGYLGDGVCPA